MVDSDGHGLDVAGGLQVGLLGDGHGQGAGDGGLAPRSRAATKVLRDGHRIGIGLAVGSLAARGPLDLAGDAVAAVDGLEHDGGDIRRRLREDAGARADPLRGPGAVGRDVLVVVVDEVDARVRDHDVGVDVVVQVLAHGQRDPVRRVDHRLAIDGAAFDDVQLVRGSDAAAHQDTRRAEGAGGEDHTACGGREVKGARVSAWTIGRGLDTGNMTCVSHQPLDVGVEDHLEVLAPVGGDEVGRHWAAALAVRVHEWRLGHGSVLLVRNAVGCHARPSCLDHGRLDQVVAVWDVELAIHGRVVGSWDSAEHTARSGGDVR